MKTLKLKFMVRMHEVKIITRLLQKHAVMRVTSSKKISSNSSILRVFWEVGGSPSN